MELGLHLGALHARLPDVGAIAAEAERLGFDSVWSGEAYGNDAPTVAAFVAARTSRLGIGTAVMQIPGRTPAMTAMTAMTLDQLSGGRFTLGLGMSGPQVVEGWHGQTFDRPLVQTREHVEIVRRAVARAEPVSLDGEWYRLPAPGGVGKPLRSTLHPQRTDLPIYLAGTGPRNVALAAEIADGWIPIFFAPSHAALFEPALREGAASSGRPACRVAPMVPVAAGPDLAKCREDARRYLALYVGGMGSRERNFYADLVRRYGYQDEVDRIQDLFLGGEREAAAAAVPEALVDELALVGPAGRIRERLDAWRDVGVSVMICLTQDPVQMAILAEAFDR